MAQGREDCFRRVMGDLHTVFSAAIAGFFTKISTADSAFTPNEIRRLQDQIQKFRGEFRTALNTRGHLRNITNTPPAQSRTASDRASEAPVATPQQCSKANMLKHIKDVRDGRVGSEMATGFSFLTVADLFVEQALPWETIALEYIERCWTEMKVFVTFVISRLVQGNIQTQTAIMSAVLDPLLDEIIAESKQLLDQLSAFPCQGYYLLYDREFHAIIHNKRQELRKKELTKRLLGLAAPAITGSVSEHNEIYALALGRLTIAQLVGRMASQSALDLDEYACLEMLYCMQGVYKVCIPHYTYLHAER